MKERSPRRSGFGVLGIGAAACVACCAVPIFGVLGGIGAIGLISTRFIGAAGVLLAVAAAVAFVLRRRRATARTTDAGPVPVELKRRSS